MLFSLSTPSLLFFLSRTQSIHTRSCPLLSFPLILPQIIAVASVCTLLFLCRAALLLALVDYRGVVTGRDTDLTLDEDSECMWKILDICQLS